MNENEEGGRVVRAAHYIYLGPPSLKTRQNSFGFTGQGKGE